MHFTIIPSSSYEMVPLNMAEVRTSLVAGDVLTVKGRRRRSSVVEQVVCSLFWFTVNRVSPYSRRAISRGVRTHSTLTHGVSRPFPPSEPTHDEAIVR